MGKIKKLIESELVGGTQGTEVYPITSTKAVYNKRNRDLDTTLNESLVRNLSLEYSDGGTPKVMRLTEAANLVAKEDRKLSANIKILTEGGWGTYQYVGDSLEKWSDELSWVNINNLTGPYQGFLVNVSIDNWKGGTSFLYIDYIYRNDPTYDSGIRIKKDDGTQVLYLSNLTGVKSGVETFTRELSGGLGTINLTVNWDCIPNQFNSVISGGLRFPDSAYHVHFSTIQDLENIQSGINTKLDRIPFYNGGLPMILPTSSLQDETSNGNTLTPLILSNFLLDFKLEGDGEEGVDYVFYFQYQKSGSVPYANYLAVYKVDSGSTRTLVAALNLLGSAPKGVSVYDIPIQKSYSFLTKATVYLNYDALSGFTNSDKYSAFSMPSYKFNQQYLFDKSSGVLHDIEVSKGEIKRIEDIANGADIKATQANEKLVTTESVTWELENDLNFFTSGWYGYKNLGQYTKVLESPTAFSQIRVNKVRANTSDTTINYKVCIVKGIASPSRRECPIGPISPSTHTVIKEGTLNLSNSYTDYLIDLGDIYVCPAGSQVAIYMENPKGEIISARGSSRGEGNPEKTSNLALLCAEPEPLNGGNWLAGSLESDNAGYFNVALSLKIVPIFASTEQVASIAEESVRELVPEFINPNIKLTIPDKIYAVVGTELNIWNDTVSLSVDRGLHSPLNYQVKWYCSKGLVTDRCYRFTPTDSDKGNTYNCTCSIYDVRNELIESKTFQIIVLGKDGISSAKNIVYFGDSLGANAAKELYNNFNSSEKFTGTIPTMLGTQGTSNKYEAIGGYGWKSYATKGEQGYRVPVSGVTALSVGAIYKASNNNVFKVKEVNISDGSGNILLYKHYETSIGGYGELPLPSGTLTKVRGDGDDSVTYSEAFQESANPLWNDELDSLDISKYKEEIGIEPDAKIDAASFQFGINDASLADDLETLEKYISDLYNMFINDNPNFKMLIGLTTSAGNDVNGAGANYGASWDHITYLDRVYRIRQFYLTLQNNEKYPNIIIAPISLQVDRYYGYNFSERPISQRYTETEKYHNNYVHPGPSGYGQIADGYFGTFIYALSD